MKKIAKEDIIDMGEWYVPTSWDEVKLRQIQEISALGEDADNIAIIAILTGKTKEEVKMLPLQFFESIMAHLYFMNEKYEAEPSDTIHIGGETYKAALSEEMKTGEFAAAMTAMQQNRNDLASLLAIICRKEGEAFDADYEHTKYSMRKKMFEDAPYTAVAGTIAFFLTKLTLSGENLDYYLKEKATTINALLQETRNLIDDGVGRGSCIQRLKALYKLRKLRRLMQRIGSST